MSELDDVEQQIQKVLTDHKMKVGYDILFPLYAQLPDAVKLALLVLQQHGMKIIFTIKPEKEA